MPSPSPLPAPQESELQQIENLYRMLLSEDGPCALAGPSGQMLPLPQSVRDLLVGVLLKMREGKCVRLVPVTEELTTQKAAEVLGVSRQYLVRLLEDGKIPFHRAGTHRRVYLTDLLSYQHERDEARLAGIRAMAQEALAAGEYDTFIEPGDDE